MLRHRQFLGDLAAVDRSQELREVLPKFKNPVVEEFRRGGDLSRVVASIEKNKYVELVAAVGAGKSTRCPAQLAEALGTLVIHTIPFHLAARVLADFLKGTAGGSTRVSYTDDVREPLPDSGVVLMSTQHFHARWFHNKFADVSGSPLLYMDEVHESDCFTAVLRDVAPGIRKFRGVVRATATASPGAAVRPDLPGARIERTYPRSSVAKWSALDTGKPWSADDISENTMLCVDREETRVRLASEYRNNGFTVRVCTSAVTYEYYRETERMLGDMTAGIVVVLVDYAFRSSFTIPGVLRFIDSCEVAVPCVESGFPSVKYRPAYDFEVQQFLGRGGRLPGQRVELFRTAEASPKYMCDLECLEAVAANLLFRMYGFRPPIKMSDFPYYSGAVPADLAGALVSDHPLELFPNESRVPWVTSSKVPDEPAPVVPEFQYKLGQGTVRERRAAACDTVYEPLVRPTSVVSNYLAGMERTALGRSLTRSPSPDMATVFTLDSQYDNLAAFQDPNDPPFAKPKRVANHIRLQREEAARKLAEASVAEAAVEGEVSSVPDSDAVREDSQSVDQAVSSVVVRDFHAADTVLATAKTVLQAKQEQQLPSISDDMLGNYVFYPGMDQAADVSAAFILGLQSVYRFCDNTEARHQAKGLHSRDRLYAMRLLVDEFNEATAVAMGIQRLFAEISKRPPDQFRDLVDHGELIKCFDHISVESASAQARARVARDVMPFFMDFSLSAMPPVLQLEQKVMMQMMEYIEKSAVKRDPDKIAEYLNSLNSKAIKINERRGSNNRDNRRRIL